MNSEFQLSTNGNFQIAFIYNLLSVMIIICSPFLIKYENFSTKSKQINPQFTYSNLLPFNKLERMNEDQKSIPSSSQKDFHFVTKCFYCTHFLIAYLYNNLEKKYSQIITDLSKTREINFYEFQKLLNKKFGYEAHLNNEEYISNLSNFSHFSIIWILTHLSEKIEDNSEDFIIQFSTKTYFPIITKEFSLIPEIILINLNEIVSFYKFLENRKFFSQPIFLRDLSILYSILYRFPILKNPHLKAQLIPLFASFIDSIENNKDQSLIIRIFLSLCT